MPSLRSDSDADVKGWLADLEAKAQAPVSGYGSGYGSTYFGQGDGLTPAAADLPLYMNVVVAASIGWLARNLPVADLHVISVTGQGDGPEIPNHPFIALMDQPNKVDDFFSLWQSFLFSDVIRGDTLYVKLPNRGGGIHSLWWVAPWDFQPVANPVRDADRPILRYEVRTGGQVISYQPEEVVHIKDGRDPLNPFRGMSPLMAGLRAATTIDRTEFYTQTLMRNCGAISGMLSPSNPDMEINDKNVDSLRNQFATRQTGENNGRPFVSTQSLRFDKMSLSPEQMAVDKIRDFPAASLAALIGVPLMVLGFPDPGKTYSNLSEGDRQAWNNGLIPRMARAAEAFDRQCPELIKPNQRLKWDFKHVKALQEDWVAKVDSLVKASGGKAILTVNEAREAIHLEPIKGQDELAVPAPPVMPPVLPIGPPKPTLGLPAPDAKPKSDDSDVETKEDMPADGAVPAGDIPDPHEDNTFGLPDGGPLRKALKRFADLQAAQVLGTIPEIGVPIPASFPSLTDYNDPMASAMTPIISSYWDWGGKTTLAKLGLDPDVWRVVDPNLHRKIAEATLAFCDSTNQTTTLRLNDALAQLRRELQEGIVDQGETIPQLTDRVQSVFTDLKRNRAESIARTETSRAIHQASQQSASDADVCDGKKWLISANSCPLCLAVGESSKDGIPMDALFTVQGNNPTYKNVYCPPLHPHCRCTVTYVLNKEFRDMIEAGTGKPSPATITPLDSKQKPIRLAKEPA